jgi:hypothetical protein
LQGLFLYDSKTSKIYRAKAAFRRSAKSRAHSYRENVVSSPVLKLTINSSLKGGYDASNILIVFLLLILLFGFGRIAKAIW